MIESPEILLADFRQAATAVGLRCEDSAVAHDREPAPHPAPPLPKGKSAVYVFSLSASHGGQCPAGPHRVLKVGKVGPNSNPRFQSQHYNPRSAQSTLARSLLRAPILWPYLGITGLTEAAVGAWIKNHTDRDHFFLDISHLDLLGQLERYIRARLGPAFEGG
jgi:hypothetical protein